MRYTGIQPQYFPRLHYFARIINTDIFMIRDDAQFVAKHKYPDGRTDKSYQAHTPIKLLEGRKLLPVPVKHAGLQPIYQVKIANEQKWIEKHLKYLKVGYQKAPHFSKIYSQIKDLLQISSTNLSRLNMKTILWGLSQLLSEDIRLNDLTLVNLNQLLHQQKKFRLKEIRLATSTKSFKSGQNLSANEKIVHLIQELGANEDYCGGTAHQAYMDMELFKSSGIIITVQDWHGKAYPQQFWDRTEFIPNLSIIDLLMNVTVTDALKILNGAN